MLKIWKSQDCTEIGLRADINVNVRKSKLFYKKGVADCERLL